MLNVVFVGLSWPFKFWNVFKYKQVVRSCILKREFFKNTRNKLSVFQFRADSSQVRSLRRSTEMVKFEIS